MRSAVTATLKRLKKQNSFSGFEFLYVATTKKFYWATCSTCSMVCNGDSARLKEAKKGGLMDEFKSSLIAISHRTDVTHLYQREVDVRTLSFSERLLNGVKGLAVCWLAAIAFVFVPVMHFFLVPLAALAGLILFFRKASLKEVIAETVIICPVCKNQIKVSGQAFNWPIREMCENCRNDLVLDPVS